MENILQVLNIYKSRGLYPELLRFDKSSTKPETSNNGKKILMFGSNNYLDLANDQGIIGNVIDILKEHGLGPGGSRILCGNVEIINEMESELAKFIGVEDVITFPTGYMANMSIFQSIMGPFLVPIHDKQGIIFSDEYNHATIIDGCRLANAKKIIYKHNNIEDIEKKILENQGSKKLTRMIVTESVYSVEGELSNLLQIEKLAKKYGLIFMVDDAHGIGVIGKGGGVRREFRFNNGPDIVMGSFDKAIGAIGGYLGGNKQTIDYLRIASRPYIFSSAIPAVVASFVIGAINKITNSPEILENTFSSARYLREQLTQSGFHLLGDSRTLAVPIYIGDDQLGIKFENELLEMGIYAPCFRAPACPLNMSRIRVSVMSSHTKKHLDELIEKTKKVGKALKLIA